MTVGYVKKYDATASIQRFLRERTGYQVDLVYDGYKYSDTRPLVTIRSMQDNNEFNVKGREAVETTYRWQIGLHAEHLSGQLKDADVINELLMLSDIPYFDYDKSADNPAGFFSVEITAVVPMPSDDIANASRRYTTYFDAELLTIKRRC